MTGEMGKLRRLSAGQSRRIRSTTIVGVRKDGTVALGGDGQVTLGDTAVKHKAQKIRRLYSGKILAGFAGATADAMTLFDKFEGKIESYSGNLPRAAVELAKEWRMDKYLRRLEALLAASDEEHSFIISGEGDVIEPDDPVVAIGSGGPYAMAAARAMLKHSDMGAKEIVEEALMITAEICIYSNENLTVEVL